MNELKVFENNEFGQVRTVTIDNEPWFVAKDVCEVLGHTNPTMAMQMLEDDERTKLSLGRAGATNVVNESGLYTLIIKSNKPSAKKFRKWITSEVLPSIRKTGGYIAGQEQMTDAELMAKALLVAQKQIEERNKQIEVMQPKVIFADAVSASQTSILVGDLAKLICQNGVQIGQKRLFEWLRKNGYLIKGGTSKNMPMQRYVEQGLFEVKESNVQNPDGSIRITKTTKVTGKGQVYFVNKFLNTR